MSSIIQDCGRVKEMIQCHRPGGHRVIKKFDSAHGGRSPGDVRIGGEFTMWADEDLLRKVCFLHASVTLMMMMIGRLSGLHRRLKPFNSFSVPVQFWISMGDMGLMHDDNIWLKRLGGYK